MSIPDAPAEVATFTIAISTEHADETISGADTAILSLPDECYVTLDGQRVLAMPSTTVFLRAVARMAAGMGETLHHVDWFITTDPAVVKTHGMLHDCDDCRDGVVRALDALAKNPRRELAVGALYWATT